MDRQSDYGSIHELRPFAEPAQNNIAHPPPSNRPADQLPASNGAHPQNSLSANSRPPSQKPHAPKKQRIWAAVWLLEILACFVSLLSLVATIIILNSFDGTELRHWSIANVSISPNTLIAIFTTVVKSSMMLAVAEGISQLKWTYFQQQPHPLLHLEVFDGASRGPLGAIKLLGTLRLKVVVVSVGAVVTVLALAIDPFTQQVLSYPVRPMEVTNDTAPSIPRTDWFNGGVSNVDTSQSPELKAVFRGMYDGVLDVDFSCPTGNCTWPLYDSLGICSTCIDTSEKTSVTCESVDTSQCGLPNAIIPVVSCLRCTYTMPVPIPWVGTDNFKAEIMYSSTDKKTYQADLLLQSNTKQASNIPPPTPEQYFINVLQISSQLLPLTTDLPQLPTVTACSVSLCSNWYLRSNFSHDRLNDSPTVSLPIEVASACTVPLCKAVPRLDKATGISQSDHDLISSVIKMQDTTYYIEDFSPGQPATGLAYILDELIGTNTWTRANLTSQPSGLLGPPLRSSIYQFHDGNVTNMMNAIATSLTTEMRQRNSTLINGLAWTPAAFVNVRWPWLIYQATLVVLACVFLGLTVAFGTEKDKLVWKSSSIALLFHGLHGPSDDRTYVRDTDGMEERAKDMKVVLGEDDGGGISFIRKP